MRKVKERKIIFITNDLIFAHQHLFYILSYFSINKNYKVYLLSSKKDKEIYKIPEKVELVPISITRRPNLHKDIVALLEIIYFILQKKPQVIFSFTNKAGFLSSISSCVFNAPVYIHTFTGQIWANMNGIKRQIYRLIDSFIAERANLSLADSESQALFLNKHLSFSKSVVGLKDGSLAGVDFKRFNRNRSSLLLDKKGIKFIFLGRLNIDKGINDLIEIIPKHLSIFIEDEFMIIGPNENQILYSELIKLKAKWPNNIKLKGFTRCPEKYLKESDILLLPSKREGFGNIIIEAASCGVPTIAYEIYGIKNAIKNKITGLLAEPYNITNFANLMKECSLDKARILDLSKNAYSFSKKFSNLNRTRVFIDAIKTNTHLKNL